MAISRGTSPILSASLAKKILGPVAFGIKGPPYHNEQERSSDEQSPLRKPLPRKNLLPLHEHRHIKPQPAIRTVSPGLRTEAGLKAVNSRGTVCWVISRLQLCVTHTTTGISRLSLSPDRQSRRLHRYIIFHCP